MDKNLIDRLVFGVAVLLGLAVGFYSATANQPKAPVAQPSVPGLIAPPCDGRCNPAKASYKPFRVVCPYCRNTLSIQPSADPTGAVVGAVAK